MSNALLDGTVKDQNGVVVPGASVYVYDGRGEDGGLSLLYDNLGQAVPNPRTTDDDGYWSAYAATDRFYTVAYYFGGRKRYVESNVLLGTLGISTDPNLRTDLAAATGATLVGTTGPSTVQADLNARPTSAALAASDGAGRIGNTKGGTVEDTIVHITPEMHGAKGDAVEGAGTTVTGTDDTAAFNAAIAALETAGGGVLRNTPGKIYLLSSQLTLPEGVRFDLNQSKLVFTLTDAAACGVKLHSNCIVENGHVRVISGGSPGAQASAHCPILVGPLYGNGGTVASPSADDNASGWIIRNMISESDKDLGAVATGGAAAIGVQGNCYDGVIENITIPDSAKLTSGIEMDWGVRGEVGGVQAIVSDPAQMGTNLTNFNNGNGFTTHPHNIAIRNISIGRLSRPYQGTATTGSFGIRHAAVYGVTVENVTVGQTTEGAFVEDAGDLGFEFATGSDLTHALRGNSFRNCRCDDAATGQAILHTSTADNVQTAITSYAYTPRFSWGAKWHTDTTWQQVSGKRSTGSASYGIDVVNADGGRFIDCQMDGFLNALRFSAADNVVVEGGRFTNSSGANIKAEDNSTHCILRNVRECSMAGATFPNVYLGACDRFTIDGGTYGIASGETGTHTIQAVDGNCTNLSIINTPTVLGHGAGSYAIGAGSSSTHNTLWLFTGVNYGPGVTNKYAGQEFRYYARSGTGVVHADGDTSPAASLIASPGSTVCRTNGGAGTTFYVKQSATDATGWAAIG